MELGSIALLSVGFAAFALLAVGAARRWSWLVGPIEADIDKQAVEESQKRASFVRGRILFFASVFICSLAVFLGQVWKLGTFTAPPASGDDEYYDMMAYSLANGRGFSTNYDDGYLKPYRQLKHPWARYDHLFSQAGHWSGRYESNALWPPMLPALVSLNYRISGRRFAVWRVFSCVLLASIVCMAAALAWRFAGAAPAVLTAIFLVADARFRFFGGRILTEPICCILLMGEVLLLLRLIKKPTWPCALGAGALIGALTLTRSVFVLWIPALIIVLVIFWRYYGPENKRKTALATTAFVLGALLVVFPWWTRNCIVLDAFMPTGVQGPTVFSYSYNDESYKRKGHIARPGPQFFKELPDVIKSKNLTGTPPAQRAKFAFSKTLDWVQDNPGKVAALLGYHIFYLWFSDFGWFHVYLNVALILGIIALWTKPQGRLLLALLVIYTLAVMTGHRNTGWRYLGPVLPLVHVLAAIGLWTLVTGAIQRASRSHTADDVETLSASTQGNAQKNQDLPAESG